ncbi:beta-glucosidase-like sfr2 [Datura stramonium]|uniref:Beta-glucosidase-like sfr2 n=1 Tax=Datura stramonium TaxID=4076 RepID=A0ABS8VJD9_DATST|nr:beta-glucosidase-like sfr2 [Datura stramonium]
MANEWADGYGPKFGLVAVDRANKSCFRIPRPFVVESGKIMRGRQEQVIQDCQKPNFGLKQEALMSYMEALYRKIGGFGHHEMGLQDPGRFAIPSASPLT